MSLFSVLLRDPRGAEFPLVSKILGDFLKVPAIDAQHKARDAWGFLGEKLSAEDAQRLAAAAQAAGAPARVVPESDLAVSPPAQSANGGGPENDVLRLTLGVPAREKRIPLADLQLIALLPLREESSSTVTVKEGPSAGERAAKITLMMTTGIPLPMGKSKEIKKTVTTGDLTVLADFFTATERFRVDAGHFGFSGLGESKTWNGLENLKRFVKMILDRRPDVPLNRGGRWVMENKTLATAGYTDRGQFEKECRWLLTLARLPR
ncbi:MAG TPA: hypothetical protein PKZ00_01560 [Elusimicrobiota bacterium]|nr:hypothetical protein [Elusimicrobiota bacterium]HNI56252.1 hypothetical protein [Elusimicrobiota bacterium]